MPSDMLPRPSKDFGLDAPEVPDTGQRDRDQPVEELIHAGASQRHRAAYGHAFAKLEVGDGLAGPGHLGLLAGDDSHLGHGVVEQLGVGLGLAHTHVHRDLGDPGDLHGVLQSQLFLELGDEFLFKLIF